MKDSKDFSPVAELIKSHYLGLVRLMQRKLGNPHMAHDLATEAAKTALEHARTGRLIASDQIFGYMIKIAMNLLRNYLRNMDNRSDVRVDTLVLESIAQPEGEDQTEFEESRRLVQRMFEPLSVRDREIIKRLYLDEEDKAQICSDLGMSEKQFNQAACRARQRLKALLESAGFSKGDLLVLCL